MLLQVILKIDVNGLLAHQRAMSVPIYNFLTKNVSFKTDYVADVLSSYSMQNVASGNSEIDINDLLAHQRQ